MYLVKCKYITEWMSHTHTHTCNFTLSRYYMQERCIQLYLICIVERALYMCDVLLYYN